MPMSQSRRGSSAWARPDHGDGPGSVEDERHAAPGRSGLPPRRGVTTPLPTTIAVLSGGTQAIWDKLDRESRIWRWGKERTVPRRAKRAFDHVTLLLTAFLGSPLSSG